MSWRRAAKFWIRRERILSFGDAHGITPITGRLEFGNLGQYRVVRGDLCGAIDLGGDGFDLVPQRQRVVINEAKSFVRLLGQRYDHTRKILCTGATVGPRR